MGIWAALAVIAAGVGYLFVRQNMAQARSGLETFRGQSGRLYTISPGEQGRGGQLNSVFLDGDLLFVFVELPDGSRSLTTTTADPATSLGLHDFGFAATSGAAS